MKHRDLGKEGTQRAYCFVEWKAVGDDDDERIIEGIASTPETDRMGDIVEPKGAQFKLPIPLLWQHNSHEPIGHVISAKVTEAGITMRAKLTKIAEPGKLKDRLDEAWQSIKYGLVRGLSIGFNPIEHAQIDGTWGLRFSKWEWLELSPVTIAANAGASIQTIKSIDTQTRAALGLTRSQAVRLDYSPGASGHHHTNVQKGHPVKTIPEQIQAAENTRAASIARMAELMSKSADTGETLDEAGATEYDSLDAEVKRIDGHITRLKSLEKLNVAGATHVNTQAAGNEGTSVQLRGGVQLVKRNVEKGVPFARFCRAIAQSRGNLMQAHEIAKQWGDTSPEVVTSLKAAMTAGTTNDSDWAEPLVEYQTMQSEFIDLLRPQTIIGRIAGLRRVPFNIRVAGKTQGSTVGWVGQGQPKPVSELKFNETTLGMAKIAGIVVISQELARSSQPSAEMMIRDDLIETIAQFSDEQFISPGIAAVPNVSPASITNGVNFAASVGDTIANISTDVEVALNRLITAKLPVASAVWIMHPSTVLSLSLKRTSQDVYAFRDELRAGTFFGRPVIQSESVPLSVSGGALVVLAVAREIFFADDGAVRVDASEQASLQMDSAPSAGAASLVSLWQNNLIGIRAERFMNWQRRRDAAVTYIDAVAW